LLDRDEAVGEVYNVGSDEEISMADLAGRIIAACDGASTVQLVPYDQAYERGFEDMARRVPDTAKLRALCGWSPRHTLADILREMIAEAALEVVPDRG
ncbi:MAG TPA: hypothetical protein PKA98_22885, partial [Acidimicrobiales bacterium]|nr:hypothetical protein [Acidimicrobiales bacterium]